MQLSSPPTLLRLHARCWDRHITPGVPQGVFKMLREDFAYQPTIKVRRVLD